MRILIKLKYVRPICTNIFETLLDLNFGADVVAAAAAAEDGEHCLNKFRVHRWHKFPFHLSYHLFRLGCLFWLYIVNDGLVQIIASTAMVTCVQKTSISHSLKLDHRSCLKQKPSDIRMNIEQSASGRLEDSFATTILSLRTSAIGITSMQNAFTLGCKPRRTKVKMCIEYLQLWWSEGLRALY